MTGVITKPDFDGYGGVILGDDGNEYFLHQSEFKTKKFARKAEKGRRVIFSVFDNGYKNQRAIGIELLSKGQYVITIVINAESNKPYPQDLVSLFVSACRKTLFKYKEIIEKNHGRFSYSLDVKNKVDENENRGNN